MTYQEIMFMSRKYPEFDQEVHAISSLVIVLQVVGFIIVKIFLREEIVQIIIAWLTDLIMQGLSFAR